MQLVVGSDAFGAAHSWSGRWQHVSTIDASLRGSKGFIMKAAAPAILASSEPSKGERARIGAVLFRCELARQAESLGASTGRSMITTGEATPVP